MKTKQPFIPHVLAWLTNIYTASGAVWGLLALKAISDQQFITAFWFMAAAVFVDASDGTVARALHIKNLTPQIDGALLDNIVDYLNYVVVPAYFLLETTLVPAALQIGLAALVVLTSAYQFTQADAKTADHFFKGFPSYWNVVIFYMFLWNLPPITNSIVLIAFSILVFVPIKYVYPSRLDYLTRRLGLRRLMLAATISWGVASVWLLWIYPQSNLPVSEFMLAFTLVYALVSVYRTFVPLPGEGETIPEPKPIRVRRRLFPKASGR